MNVDKILATMNEFGVAYLLIGGMNFMLRHEPNLLTFDVDLWIEDTAENRQRCESALVALGAEWGATDADWRPVAERRSGWLDQQAVFSLNSPHGALDIFRFVPGLSGWVESFRAAMAEQTGGGVNYHGLNDADMLCCQLALDPSAQKPSRVQKLQSLERPNP
jgi:hypothetical protein